MTALERIRLRYRVWKLRAARAGSCAGCARITSCGGCGGIIRSSANSRNKPDAMAAHAARVRIDYRHAGGRTPETGNRGLPLRQRKHLAAVSGQGARAAANVVRLRTTLSVAPALCCPIRCPLSKYCANTLISLVGHLTILPSRALLCAWLGEDYGQRRSDACSEVSWMIRLCPEESSRRVARAQRLP